MAKMRQKMKEGQDKMADKMDKLKGKMKEGKDRMKGKMDAEKDIMDQEMANVTSKIDNALAKAEKRAQKFHPCLSELVECANTDAESLRACIVGKASAGQASGRCQDYVKR
eukprot:342889_1